MYLMARLARRGGSFGGSDPVLYSLVLPKRLNERTNCDLDNFSFKSHSLILSRILEILFFLSDLKSLSPRNGTIQIWLERQGQQL